MLQKLLFLVIAAIVAFVLWNYVVPSVYHWACSIPSIAAFYFVLFVVVPVGFMLLMGLEMLVDMVLTED